MKPKEWAAKIKLLASGSGEKWPQRLDEIERFLKLLNSEDVRSYLEVGISHGFTLRYIGSGLPAGVRIVGVDQHGVWTPHLVQTMDLMKEHGQDVTIIWGDSKDPRIIEKVREHGPYDCVLIDGEHTYEAVSADWINYGPMARIVAFHDIDAERNPKWRKASFRRRFGVPQFFNELKQKHPHRCKRIVSRTNPGMGIGVLWTKADDSHDPIP